MQQKFYLNLFFTAALVRRGRGGLHGMNWYRFYFLCFAALICGCAAPLVDLVTAPEVKPLPATAAARSITLDRVVTEIAKGTVVGEWKGGVFCLGSVPLKWTADAQDFRDGDFQLIFDKLAREGGFRLPAKRSSVFEAAETGPDLLVGAKILNIKQIDCALPAGIFGPAQHKGSVRYTVHWEVYDPALSKLLLAVDIDGSGVLDEFRRDGVFEYYMRAFTSASRGLLAHPEFRKIVAAPGS
jgi:hypothetical protein